MPQATEEVITTPNPEELPKITEFTTKINELENQYGYIITAFLDFTQQGIIPILKLVRSPQIVPQNVVTPSIPEVGANIASVEPSPQADYPMTEPTPTPAPEPVLPTPPVVPDPALDGLAVVMPEEVANG